MAALCHDLGHLPFSHVAERDLLGDFGHEQWTLKIIDSDHLKPVWKKLHTAPIYLEDISKRNIVQDIKKIAIGEAKWKEIVGTSFTPWERIVSDLISGDFFGADRIDYLLRDAKSTGVAYGLFDYHQLIETLRVLPNPEGGKGEFLLGIDSNGLESCEALLLARHFMHRRIYQYSSVKAYNFHLSRYMGAVYFKNMLNHVDEFLSISDTDVISALNRAANDPFLPGHKDAKCVIFRQHRFRAIPLPDDVKESDLEEFKTTKGLTDSDISWEFEPEKRGSGKLSFPVAKRHVIIKKARECSDVLIKALSKTSNWVYIAPKYDLDLGQFLEKWDS